MNARRRDGDGDPDSLSLAEFLGMAEQDGYRIELVRGHVLREPRPAPLHGRVLTRLVYFLEDWAQSARRGVVITDGGFVLEEDPPTVRGPDLAYVTHERVPRSGYGTGLWHIAPDLAVEVRSPSNSAASIREKIEDYFRAGTRLVLVVDPKLSNAVVYEPSVPPRLIPADGTLDGGDVLPGFTLPLPLLFSL